jgi:sporulation protein YlmC with PRC-barrel domain
MNRFLTCTAVGLFLGLTPALAESQNPANDSQDQPALQQPAQPSEAMPAEPSDPAAPVPDASSVEPDKSSQMAPQIDPSAPDAASPEASPPAQSSEAPQSIMPAPSAAVSSNSAQFLNKQESDDWLASNLIGKSVVNAQDESIGEINDLVTDRSGKIVAVLIGTGGILGIGEKDVGVRFEDLKLARDENNDVKVIANLSQETLASAPDYETLAEQQVTVGSNKTDREDTGAQKY